MKDLKQLPLALLILAITCSACKKDKVAESDKFDINSPVGYFIYVTQLVDIGGGDTQAVQRLFEFLPEKKIRIHEATSDGNNGRSIAYDIVDNNVVALVDSDLQFTIENGKVSSNYPHFETLALLKASGTNQLAGKTFAGTYFKPDKSVLHQNFFYSFAAEGNKVGAGFTVGNALRTENYSSIGNIAARVAVVGNADLEFMVLVNGKLEASYYKKNIDAVYYGSFSQQ